MPRSARRAAFIVGAALCVPLLPFLVVGELPGERWLSMSDGHALQFALAGAALLAADMLLPLPSSLVGTMLGARLGFAAGFVSAFIGLVAGQVAAFAVTRAVSRAVARGAQEDLIRAPAPVILLLSRPVPVLAEAVVIAAGAARLGWVPFLLACTSGNALYAAALALNGSQLLPGGLIGPGLLLPMLLPALAWLIWQWRRRNPDRGA